MGVGVESVKLGNSTIYIIATDPLLKSSAKLTLQVLESLKPKAVILEMCEERKHLVELTSERLSQYRAFD